MKRASCLAVFFCSVFFSATIVHAQKNYDFINVMESGGNILSFSQASISDKGSIAFTAHLEDGQSAIYRYWNGEIAQIAISGDEFRVVQFPDINNSGLVAFWAIPSASSDWFHGSILGGYGGETTYQEYIKYTEITYDSDYSYVSRPIGVCLNNQDNVAFGAGTLSSQAIYVGDGSGTTLGDFELALDSSKEFGRVYDICINDAGVISVLSFCHWTDSDFCQDREQVLFVIDEYDSDVTDSNLVAVSNEEFDGIFGTGINKEGAVIFKANYGLSRKEPGIYVGVGGESRPTDLIPISGPLSTETPGTYWGQAHPSINTRGQVVFHAYATYKGSENIGVYTGSNPADDKVLEPGDFLDGKVVAHAVVQGKNAINQFGQIALVVIFEDDSRAVYRADPAVQGPVNPHDRFGFPVGEGECNEHPLSSYVVTWDINHKEIGPDGTTYEEHTGEDWNRGSPREDYGDPVCSIGKGKVIFSDEGSKEWGHVIVIEHTLPGNQKVWSQYAHLKERFVEEGPVRKGQIIGTIGDANGEYSPHLHWEVRKKNVSPENWPFDPSIYLDPSDVETDHYPQEGYIENN